jgi:hypothetical protein
MTWRARSPRSEAVDGPHAAVLVVGDSGVGKTYLCHFLCHGEYLDNPQWTVGCNVFAKRLQRSPAPPLPVQFWDVGGNAQYKSSRAVFFTKSPPFDGNPPPPPLTAEASSSSRTRRSPRRPTRGCASSETSPRTARPCSG